MESMEIQKSGCEPLSEELKKKMVDELKCFSYVDHLIQPRTDLIDPDDQRDIANRFSHTKSLLFTPNTKPHRPGIPIDGASLFELYSIVVTKLDPIRRFSSIYMLANSTAHLPLIVYKRPPFTSDKDIINTPLPINDIFRLPQTCYPIVFALSNPRTWSWHLPNLIHPEDLEYGSVHKDTFRDEFTDSEAVISYELVKSAAVAELSFQFVFEHEHAYSLLGLSPAVLLSGTIYATTRGNMSTRRIIQDFPKPMKFKTKEVLQVVNRFAFAVPVGSSLVVHFDLVVDYDDLGNKDYLQGTKTNMEDNDFVQGSLEFVVPTITNSEKSCLSSVRGSAKITVKVNWRDYFV